MNTVLLTEGKHDINFLKVLHDSYSESSPQYDTFNLTESQTNQETRVRQHIFGDNYEYLYKSEGGYSEVLKKFRAQTDRLSDMNLKIIVDLDDDEPSDHFRKLNRCINKQHRGDMNVEYRKKKSNKIMAFYNCDLIVRGSKAGEFETAVFYQDLEAETGIKDKEDRTEWIRKSKIFKDMCPSLWEDIIHFVFNGVD